MVRFITTMTLILVGAFIISFMTLSATRITDNWLVFVPNPTNKTINSNQTRGGPVNNNIY